MFKNQKCFIKIRFCNDDFVRVSKDKYKNWMIDKVRGVYKKMLDAGATSVWEVEDCIATFGDAGSMCHAWACVPVYLFHELGLVNYR